MKFTTAIVQGQSKNVAGIVIPDAVVEALGGGRRAPVAITINGYTYRSTLAVMGGRSMVGVTIEHRQNAGVAGGDIVEVDIVLDTTPRTVELPDDLVAALDHAGVCAGFELLAYSVRKEHVRSIDDAKSPETRSRRIDKAIEAARARAST
jgi:hypothetical protein